MNMRELLQQDIDEVFFSEDDFAESVVFTEIDNDNNYVNYDFIGHFEPFIKDIKESESLEDIFSAIDKMVIVKYPVDYTTDTPAEIAEKAAKRSFINRLDAGESIMANGRDYIIGEVFVDKNVATIRLKEVFGP